MRRGRNPVPRAAEREDFGTRPARLHRLYGKPCDPVRVRTAYRCRAYPDQAQQQVLARTFGCVRVVWNRTLAERHRLYHAEGKSILAAGLAVSACGADVRHSGSSRVRSAVKQEPRPVTAGIPVLQGGE